MINDDEKVDKLNQKPDPPNIFWISTVIVTAGLAFIYNHENYIRLLEIAILFLVVFVLVAIYWATQCHKNKTSLYRTHKEMLGTLKTQIALREQAEEELNTYKEEWIPLFLEMKEQLQKKRRVG